MTPVIVEDRLGFQFAEPWRALKWDASEPEPRPHLYRDGIEKLQGTLTVVKDEVEKAHIESTKAVDIVAASNEGVLCLIEVKDFRSDPSSDGGPRSINSRGRWKELPLEIALKVRDTLAGLLGVVQRGSPADVVAWLRPALHGDIFVFAFIAQDKVSPREPEAKRKARDSEMRNNLKRRLAWLSDVSRRVQLLDPVQDLLPAELRGIEVRPLGSACPANIQAEAEAFHHASVVTSSRPRGRRERKR